MVNIRHIAISIFLFMNFRIFQYFPGMKYVQELWYVLCAAVLLFTYPIIKLNDSLVFTKTEIYLLIMIILIPLMSMFPAYFVFGQPLFYGLVSMRGVFLLAGVLLLLICLRHEIISFAMLEKSFVIIIWSSFCLYILMNLFLNPDSFHDYGLGFVVKGYGNEKSGFKFQDNFQILGVFYYFFKGFKEKTKMSYVYSVVLLMFLFAGHGGRGMTISLGFTLLYFLYRWGGLTRIFKFVPVVVIGVILFVSVAYLISPEQVINRAGKFSDAFTVVLKREEVEDTSANARLLTTLAAIPYIENHFIFGCGNISSQWNDGFGGVIGTYFHPSDIGFIGIIFMYGVVGLIIYLYQVVLALKASKSSRYQECNPLIDAAKCILMYLFIYSIQTGFFVHNIEITMTYIVIIACYGVRDNGVGSYTAC